jgi:hypothetical protein
MLIMLSRLVAAPAQTVLARLSLSERLILEVVIGLLSGVLIRRLMALAGTFQVLFPLILLVGLIPDSGENDGSR